MVHHELSRLELKKFDGLPLKSAGFADPLTFSLAPPGMDAVKYDTDIHGAQRTSPNKFGALSRIKD